MKRLKFGFKTSENGERWKMKGEIKQRRGWVMKVTYIMKQGEELCRLYKGKGNRDSRSTTTKAKLHCEHEMQFFKWKTMKSCAKKERLAQKNASIHTVYCSFCACYSYLFNANGKKMLSVLYLSGALPLYLILYHPPSFPPYFSLALSRYERF